MAWKRKEKELTKEEALEILKAFLGDDADKAEKAFEELQIRDFRLAILMTEAWNMATDARISCMSFSMAVERR